MNLSHDMPFSFVFLFNWSQVVISVRCHFKLDAISPIELQKPNLLYAVRWILWFTLGYAAAAAVCRDFTVTPLEAAIFQLSFLNLVCMFLVIRACLGIFLGSFRKNNMAARALFMLKNAIF